MTLREGDIFGVGLTGKTSGALNIQMTVCSLLSEKIRQKVTEVERLPIVANAINHLHF